MKVATTLDWPQCDSQQLKNALRGKEAANRREALTVTFKANESHEPPCCEILKKPHPLYPSYQKCNTNGPIVKFSPFFIHMLLTVPCQRALSSEITFKEKGPFASSPLPSKARPEEVGIRMGQGSCRSKGRKERGQVPKSSPAHARRS